MGRHLLNLLALLSPLLCGVAVVACRVSLTHPDSWSEYARLRHCTLSNRDGVLSVQWHRGRNADDSPIDPPAPWRLAGVAYQRGVGLYVPFGHVLMLLLVPPLLRLILTRESPARDGE